MGYAVADPSDHLTGMYRLAEDDQGRNRLIGRPQSI
jgi:hypothetical protein